MWQSLGRSLRGLLTAVFLLVFCLCALEVGLRIDRYQAACTLTAARSNVALTIEEQLLAPSMTCWTELVPLARITRNAPDSGASVLVTINSFGCRGPEPELPRPSGKLRVLCLGDETTLATEVSASDTYAARLEQLLQNEMRTPVEVINAGLPGNCPLQAALQLRHRLLTLQPDLVVVHFDMSDVADNAALRRFVTLDRDDHPLLSINPAARKGGQLCGKKLSEEFLVIHQAETVLSKVWGQRTSGVSSDALVDPKTRYLWTSDHPPDQTEAILSALEPLQAIRELCEQSGAKLLVSSAPKPWQVSAQASPTREARAPNGIPKGAVWSNPAPFQRLLNACREWEIPAVVAWNEFRQAEQPENLFLQTSPQMSEEGHRLYAEVLARAILGHETPSAAGPRDIEPAQAIERTPDWSQPQGESR
ncbi:MAG: hypothetical protein DWH91_03985 [Planctomycetota bacterium]|nr:MAG: hypothetical protein DWH91_03985 [Planctomycetota bacterium]